ncbi:hypothetical protein DRO69_06980 [Candidatus Bathyarchaeota archaeon]|nr:MAG: hypothetical protein DRO69_06980 [Candidatus Bathyarchaeota archaeon]
MSKIKIGFVTVASVYEVGVDEAEKLMDMAIENLQNKGLAVIAAKPVLTNHSNLNAIIKQLKNEDICLLVLMNGTWTADSLQVDLIKSINKHTLLWALPYPATYSLASVIHVGSILSELGIPFSYVYGTPDDEQAINKVIQTARIAKLAELWKHMKVGKIGRRFTWRTAGPTDITYDELDLKLSQGITAVHIDIDELFLLVKNITDKTAKGFINHLKQQGKLGVIEVEEKILIDAVKVYFAVKELMKKYDLDALTIECYPRYSGLDNLASALLADEGIVSLCEGDLSHAALTLILQRLTNKPAALLEPVKILDSENALILRHEGSGAPSLSENISEVHLKPAGNGKGIIIFSSIKPTKVTLATIFGKRENYKMCILTGQTLKLSEADIDRYGGGLVTKLKVSTNVRKLVDKLMSLGVDHHMILIFGNVTNELTEFCKMVKIEPMLL